MPRMRQPEDRMPAVHIRGRIFVFVSVGLSECTILRGRRRWLRHLIDATRAVASGTIARSTPTRSAKPLLKGILNHAGRC